MTAVTDPDHGRATLTRIIRKGSDFGSQDGVIVSRTKDRTLPLSSRLHAYGTNVEGDQPVDTILATVKALDSHETLHADW